MIGRGERPTGARDRDHLTIEQGRQRCAPPRPAAPLTRRTLTRGGVWSVPAVAVATSAAPVYATTSPCSPDTTGVVTWNGQTGATATTGTMSTGGTISVNSVANGGTRLDTAWTNLGRNNQISVVPEYTGVLWLQLAQGGNNLLGQTLTVTFPVPVYCVSFYVQDIDTHWAAAPSAGACNDTITVSGFTAALTGSNDNTTVSGNQAYATVTADEEAGQANNWDYRSNDNGLVEFAATGPITSFTVDYTNPAAFTDLTGATNNMMQAWVSPISYSTVACAC